jgi:hypothetical protein
MNMNTSSASASLTRVQTVLFIARCEERLARAGRADMATAVALATIAGAARGWAQSVPSGRHAHARSFPGVAQRAVGLVCESNAIKSAVACVAATIHSAMTHRGSDGFSGEQMASVAGDAMIKACRLGDAAAADEKRWQNDMVSAMVRHDQASVGRLMNGRSEPRRKKLSMDSVGAAAIGGIDSQRVSAPQFGVQNQRRVQRAA